MATTTGGVTTFERQTLPNGARLLTAPMANVQSTSCFLMFAAGSRYETAESNRDRALRRAHVLQGDGAPADGARHRGRDRRQFNAFTGKEYTGYYVRCAAEHAPVAFDVLIDMIKHSKFDEEEIEREKGVIIEEMNMYFDTPRDYLSGLYEQLVYGDQPLGWDIIGRKETVRGATRETFLDYLDRWYKPGRLVVGVGGKIDDALLERVEELAAEFSRATPRGQIPRS